MVEFFRLLTTYIEITETCQRDLIHIIIHLLHVTMNQRPYKTFIAVSPATKPISEHSKKHYLRFLVSDLQMIPGLHLLAPILYFLRFQIPARHKKTPNRILIPFQLIKYDLLVKIYHNLCSLQQSFHLLLHLTGSRPDQSVNKPIGTGRCPVSPILALIQKAGNGPWIINISPASKNKAVIPLLYPHFFLFHSKSVQRSKHFLFRKAKTAAVLLGSRRHNIQIIQI